MLDRYWLITAATFLSVSVTAIHAASSQATGDNNAVSAGRGCVGITVDACISSLRSQGHTLNPNAGQAPSTQDEIRPRREPVIRRDFYIGPPTSERWEDGWFSISRDSIRVAAESPNRSGATINWLQVNFRGSVVRREGNTFSQFDQARIWPILNDILPTSCRFSSREAAYRFIDDLGKGLRTRRDEVVTFRFESSVQHVEAASERVFCGLRMELRLHFQHGITRSGPIEFAETYFTFRPAARPGSQRSQANP